MALAGRTSQRIFAPATGAGAGSAAAGVCSLKAAYLSGWRSRK